MASWHLEIVSHATGRVLCAADPVDAFVRDISGAVSGDVVVILVDGKDLAVGYPTSAEAEARDYSLRRWALDQPDPNVQETPLR